MSKHHRSGQDWILDRLFSSLGMDALMPSFQTYVTSPMIGFNVADMARIAERTRGSGRSLLREYTAIGDHRGKIARNAEREGHLATARRHYYYSAQAYVIAQYLIQEDGSERKADLHGASQEAYGRVCKYSDYPLEKVEVPFTCDGWDGASIPAYLHLPPGEGPFPCVVQMMGTDTCKEQGPNPEDNAYLKRGFACLAIDGPGQGECLLRGLKVSIRGRNFEKAIIAALDYAADRPEIDADQLAILGFSWGAWTIASAAIDEAEGKDRLRGCVGVMAQWDPGFKLEMDYAQPAFKSNFMYMCGIDDEAEFDREAEHIDLRPTIDKLSCPILISMGEFDELCPYERVEETLQLCNVPWEFRIYEEEPHPMGGVATEAIEEALDWIGDRFEGIVIPGGTIRRYSHGLVTSSEAGRVPVA